MFCLFTIKNNNPKRSCILVVFEEKECKTFKTSQDVQTTSIWKTNLPDSGTILEFYNLELKLH